MKLVAGHQVLDIAKPDVLKTVTLGGGQHDGIVWQSHLGVEASIERIDQDERLAAEVALAKLLGDQLEAKTAAIGSFQVLHHDLLGELVQVDGLVPAGAASDDLAASRRAGQRRDNGTDLGRDGAEDGEPVL